MKVVKKTSEPSKQTSNNLSVKQVAQLLNKSEQTITNWCHSGTLLASPQAFGSKLTFTIPEAEVWRMKVLLDSKAKEKEKPVSPKSKTSNHLELIDSWIRHCEQGMILDRKSNTNRRPYSSTTTHTFRQTVTKFLEKHESISFASIKSELINIPKENFGKRYGLYSVACAFYNFLIQEGHGSEEEYLKLKSLRPKRFLPAKKHSLTEDQLNEVLKVCKDTYERTLITLLAYTGVRNAELRALRLADISLEKKTLDVRLGKGNKPRQIGLNQLSIQALDTYLKTHPKTDTDYLFTRILRATEEEVQLTADALIQKVKAIGKRKKFPLSPHALRRSFVTINANKGRNLVAIQLLCGHADLNTTRGYCMTSQDEAVQQSQDWD